MTNLSFGGLATASAQSTGGQFMRAYNIYEGVKLSEISDPITGKKQDGSDWKAYDFIFEDQNGATYKERIFVPDGEAAVTRRDKPNGNGQFPSDMERIQTFIAHVVGTLNPDGFKKLQVAAPKIKGFDELFAVVKKIMTGCTNTTKMKLGGRVNNGTVYASLPNFVNVNKNGECYLSDNFLGENVAFSAWELGKKQEMEKATPTKMESSDSTLNVSEPESDDSNLDDLINSL